MRRRRCALHASFHLPEAPVLPSTCLLHLALIGEKKTPQDGWNMLGIHLGSSTHLGVNGSKREAVALKLKVRGKEPQIVVHCLASPGCFLKEENFVLFHGMGENLAGTADVLHLRQLRSLPH